MDIPVYVFETLSSVVEQTIEIAFYVYIVYAKKALVVLGFVEVVNQIVINAA